MKKFAISYITALASMLLLYQSAWAASGTKLHNLRLGMHPGFTRLVFDSEGAHPLAIGPLSSEGIIVRYRHLEFSTEPEDLFKKSLGAIAKVTYSREQNSSQISITFKDPGTQVKTFFLPADPPLDLGYRLVLDLYPPVTPSPLDATPSPAEPDLKPESIKQTKVVQTISQDTQRTETKTNSKPEELPKASLQSTGTDQEGFDRQVRNEGNTENEVGQAPEASAEKEPPNEPILRGEVAIIVNSVHGEGDSAQFEQYRDISPITGELDIDYEKKDEYFIKIFAHDIAEQDQYYNLIGGRYGKYKIDISYDEIPHRFAFDAKNIFSGAGTGILTLADRQNVSLEDRLSRLDALLADATPLDIELQRKRAKLSADVVSLDPFNFRVEFARENRDGTKSFFGPFGLDNTVEIPQPIDYDTSEVRLVTEYAKRPLYFNATYHLSLFENNIDTLSWDNPFRVTDADLEPSKGLTGLPPNNQYHNIAITGSYLDFPLSSNVSFTASWGWMKQDDLFVPYTTNTAITTPSGENASDLDSLPQKSVDAEVRTSLYDVLLTSRPFHVMHLKAKFRYFEYDNRTEQIDFPGFVNVDSYFVTPNVPGATSIVNLPTSYRNTTGNLDLRFDVYKRTWLNLGYKFQETDRTNREVAKQKDHIFSGALDTKPFTWLDLRLSYERIDREISDYDFDVYLDSGQDLFQMPGLRKYDEADLIRNRFQLLANLYPWEQIGVSSSFIYGQDDFKNSAFGLLEDNHYIFTFDVDYGITERLNLHAFYSYENYQNRQKARGEVPSQPAAVESDWFSRDEEFVNTVGGGIRVTLIKNKLDFDLSYSYSDVDGVIDFFTPAVATAEFPTVDETKLHILTTKFIYTIGHGLSLTFGYLWEKFDYEDFNTEGFANIPVDASGNYNGAYLMGSLYEGYNAHVVYLKTAYRF